MLLENRYQIQEPIGRGLLAIVHRGIDNRADHVVAIKVLREVYSSDPKFARRFKKKQRSYPHCSIQTLSRSMTVARPMESISLSWNW